jgi:hypothetical protein
VPEDSAFYVAIAVAFFGFVALAFILLYPIYRFLRREEQRSEAWTRAALAARQRQAIEQSERAAASGNGAGGGEGGPGESPEPG